MTKILIIVTFLLATAPKTFGSQETVQVRPAYLPNKTYYFEMKQQSTTTIVDIQGKGNTGQEFTGPGAKGPFKKDETTQESIFIIETGQKEKDGSFLVTLTPKPDRTTNVPSGTIQGKMLTDGSMVMQGLNFDGKEMDAANKTMSILLGWMKQVQPVEKPVKVGDEFTQQIFPKLPTWGADDVDFKITTKYQLTDINNGKAYFSLDQSASMASAPGQTRGKLDGHGTGSMIYDIASSFVTYQRSDMKMNVLVETPDFCLVTEDISKAEVSVDIRDRTNLRSTEHKQCQHIGVWSAKDNSGAVLSLAFDEDGTVTMTHHHSTIKCKYEIDYSKKPVCLDIIVPQDGEGFRMKSIVELIGNNKMRWRTFHADRRPSAFLPEDDEHTLILKRVEE